jgi:hypothetical protein
MLIMLQTMAIHRRVVIAPLSFALMSLTGISGATGVWNTSASRPTGLGRQVPHENNPPRLQNGFYCDK